MSAALSQMQLAARNVHNVHSSARRLSPTGRVSLRSSSSPADAAPRRGSVRVTCKAGKKAGRKGKNAAPSTSNDDIPNDNGGDAARSAAATIGSSPEDDLKIPYGDASGAAMVLRDVMLSVADTDLLNDGCATVMKGQVVGLVGGNGCGKSTLLKCIAGARAVDDGAICISTDLEARDGAGGPGARLCVDVHALFFFPSTFPRNAAAARLFTFRLSSCRLWTSSNPRRFRRHLRPREELSRLSGRVQVGRALVHSL